MELLGAKVVAYEIVIELPLDTLFDCDKYNIRPHAAAALEKLLVLINAQGSGGDQYPLLTMIMI